MEKLSNRESRHAQREQLKEHRRFNHEHLKELDQSMRAQRKQKELYKPEARWPYITTALLFLSSFVPILGWVNVFGLPILIVVWVMVAVQSSYRYRAYGIALLFAFINAGLSLFLQISYLLHWN